MRLVQEKQGLSNFLVAGICLAFLLLRARGNILLVLLQQALVCLLHSSISRTVEGCKLCHLPSSFVV